MNGFNCTVSCKSLDELWLHVIYKCNLSCRHCLFECSPETEGPGQLSSGECQKYVAAAVKQGLKSVYITGGEPLLWNGMRDFLNWYYSNDVILPLTILTNGTLIDDDMAKFFSNFASQGLNIRISLECYTRENNDDYRGQGSFAKAVEGIKRLNGYNIRPWIAYVNKSGGSLDCCMAGQLEKDFETRLLEEYGLTIAGLKIIAAYSKGRFNGQVNHAARPVQNEVEISTVQCNYGIAVSKSGIYPCPVLVDVPEAKIPRSLEEVVGETHVLNYDFCSSCFTTGTRCGQ